MNVELDEVYLASIKEMFKEFDDEIIWTAIFEHGFDEKGNQKLEDVVNYLLELSSEINQDNDKIKIPESNISTNEITKENTNNILDNETDCLLNINDQEEDAEEILPIIFQNFINLIKDNNGYQKINNE